MRNEEDGCVYAVKLINIKRAGTGVEKLREEAARLSMLNHPNIVRYFTAFRFKKNKFFAIVMELLKGGSLLERLQRVSGPLTSGQRPREAQTEQWARQVASALAHMHARRMQHRDLKPDNVLFDEHQNARVIDVGLAVVVVAKSKVSSRGGANKVGALMYQSPEKAQGRAYDGKDDVWALGCMLGGAVTGKLVEARSTGVFALDPEAVKAFVKETNAASARFGCLVTTMLAKNPMVRPAAQGVEWALATGASVFAGGAAIVEEEEEDEEDEAEQRRRVAQDMASMSLFDACKEGRSDIVQAWLDRGADANSPTDDWGRTPLYIACKNGHVDAARLVLEKGAEVDRANQNGATPLFIACQQGHVEAARLLLDLSLIHI